MPTPSFSVLNGQIKTVLRVYASDEERWASRAECQEESDCPFELLTGNDALLSFQFPRTSSVLGITSWTVYDANGNQIADLSGSLDLLLIEPFSGFDYVTYKGDALDELLPEGTYHFVINTGGHDYISDDFTVPCHSFGENMLPEPAFDGGLYSQANLNAIWSISNWARRLTAVKNTAGAPTDPAHEFEGSQVANTNENVLYTYTGGSWVSSTPPNSTGWYDDQTGNWYRFQSGTWQGLVSDPLTVDENGICYDGASFPFSAPSVSVDVGSHDCAESIVRFEFTIEGMTQGQVTVTSDEYGGMIVEEDGSYSFQAYVANGYLWSFTPSLGFDGCITSARLLCPQGLSDCNMELRWTNCGNVGNISYDTGMVQRYWIHADKLRPRPQPRLFIEQEEDQNGNIVETLRRKETEYTLNLGPVSFPVADAITEMALHDTITLHYPGLSAYDTLAAVQVVTTPIENYSKCLVGCVVTFQLKNTTVSCCDSLDAPCLTSCTVVAGFDNDTLVNGNVYAFRNFPRYALYQGGSFQPYSVCTTGLITVDETGDGADYTAYWSINNNEWAPVGLFTLVDPESTSPLCLITVRGTIMPGYRAVLEVMPEGQLGFEETDLDLSAEDWATNTEQIEAPAHEGIFRFKVYINDCVIGYSAEEPFTCGS